MKPTAYAVLLLTFAAVASQAAPTNIDTAPSGVPLNIAKRLHQLPTPPQVATEVTLTGVPMRAATLPAAFRMPGKSAEVSCPVALTGIPMVKVTRPLFSAPPAPDRTASTC